MKLKFNGRVSRLIALAAALGVVGAAALDLFFAANEEHKCCGEGCPVCAQNQSRSDGLRYFVPPLAARGLSALALLAHLPKFNDPREVSTLVEAKVKLNE
ncbi:MAG: hypothetical protein LBC93_06615 [Synergistaceae bacterium]|jgi:hypothetical protein|nr:hypothetical protein [Synergistaceae bacterium]